ncbi:MAG: phosphoribosyltransferase [Gammaproteobacteria bacterium]|nr:phosphoribosyltransferase [Gammaproteobacteria bacterium]
MTLFENRIEAGKQLVKHLLQYQDNKNVLVLTLPRGGVPVGFQVAKTLRVPLDIFLVRKLGVPFQEELAMGAIASGGITVFNEDILRMIHISPHVIEDVKAQELAVLKRREALYRGNRTPPMIKDKIIILIDDGIATGATMRAAITALKKLECKKIVVATPVAPPDTCEQLRREVDEIVCLEMPYPFYAIGGWYQDFSQTSDEEVQDLLIQAENFGKPEGA